MDFFAIKRYAKLADLIYESTKDIEEKSEHPVLDFVSRDGSYSDTQMGVFRDIDKEGNQDGHSLVFVFRGTKEPKDVVTDFLACKREFKAVNDKYVDIRVHRGFLKAWNTVRDDVFKWIDRKRPKKIVFVGHSLGGALATLAAFDVRANTGNNNVNCVTFGSPRVGNKSFATAFNTTVKDTIRVVNAADPVTAVPLIRYKHVDSKMPIGSAPIAAIFNNVIAATTGKVLVSSLAAHHYMDTYLQELDNYGG